MQTIKILEICSLITPTVYKSPLNERNNAEFQTSISSVMYNVKMNNEFSDWFPVITRFTSAFAEVRSVMKRLW